MRSFRDTRRLPAEERKEGRNLSRRIPRRESRNDDGFLLAFWVRGKTTCEGPAAIPQDSLSRLQSRTVERNLVGLARIAHGSEWIASNRDTHFMII